MQQDKRSGVPHGIKLLMPILIMFAIIVLTIFCLLSFRTQTEKNTTKRAICPEGNCHQTIHWLWQQRKSVYLKWALDSLRDPEYLYKLQNETNNLLKYAWLIRDVDLFEQLVSVYCLPLDKLRETDQYSFYYYPGHPRRSVHSLGSKHKMWLDDVTPVGNESILSSSQFLYLLSEATNDISMLAFRERTFGLEECVRQFVPVLLDHYERWILSQPGPFQVRGWGCRNNGVYISSLMNHMELLTRKRERSLGDLNSPSYCNAVTDKDMWIIAGVVNLLGAHRRDNSLVPISPNVFDALSSYAKVGVSLLCERFEYTDLADSDGQKVIGALFEPGAWDDHEEYAFSGFEGEEFPPLGLPAQERRGRGVGWDLSHARRFVHVFDSLYRNRDVLGLSFPSLDFMEMLGNQLVYVTFNGDFRRPLFTNFVDGSNGWFRVGYADRVGFGYGPWDMSISAMTGGYAFWCEYNRDIQRVCATLFEMITSNEPGMRRHRQEHYEKNHWERYGRSGQCDFSDMENQLTQSILIQFLPSFTVCEEHIHRSEVQ